MGPVGQYQANRIEQRKPWGPIQFDGGVLNLPQHHSFGRKELSELSPRPHSRAIGVIDGNVEEPLISDGNDLSLLSPPYDLRQNRSMCVSPT